MRGDVGVSDLLAVLTRIATAVEAIAQRLPAPSAAKNEKRLSAAYKAPAPQMTPDRAALIRAEYPAGVAAHAIFARVIALPGPTVPHQDRIAMWANTNHLRRPHWFDPRTAPETLEEARRVYPPTPAAVVTPPSQAIRLPAIPRAPSKPHALPPAPVAMPAAARSILTTEATLSVADRMMREDAVSEADAPIDLDAALEWGRRNRVKMTGDLTSDFHAVNRVRVELHRLPAYRLIVPLGKPEPLPRDATYNPVAPSSIPPTHPMVRT